jgi:hypothetical protein
LCTQAISPEKKTPPNAPIAERSWYGGTLTGDAAATGLKSAGLQTPLMAKSISAVPIAGAGRELDISNAMNF